MPLPCWWITWRKVPVRKWESVTKMQNVWIWMDVMRYIPALKHALLKYITVKSSWARWRLKSPPSRLFAQLFVQAQIKENTKAPRHWPLWGESISYWWIPLTKGQWRGKSFHLMTSSWLGIFTPPPVGWLIGETEACGVQKKRMAAMAAILADDIFKCIFLYENVWISIKISLKFVPMGPIINIPALVQIMACRRPGDIPLSEPMLV